MRFVSNWLAVQSRQQAAATVFELHVNLMQKIQMIIISIIVTRLYVFSYMYKYI